MKLEIITLSITSLIFVIFLLNKKASSKSTKLRISAKALGAGIQENRNYCLGYTQRGTIFQHGKEIVQRKNITTCFLLTLSTIVEKEITRTFLSVYENITAWVKSPSILLHDGQYYVTFRARLKPQRSKRLADCWEYRCVQNYIYMKKYDLNFVPIETGHIVSIPTPQGKNKNLNGPHDPRLFEINGGMYALVTVSYAGGWMAIIWDFQTNTPHVPSFEKDIIWNGKKTFEKNWCPLVINNTLYIVRNLDPLHILKCDNLDHCMFYRNDTDPLTFKMDDGKSPLRGGTGFVEYQYPYYIAIAHTTNFRKRSRFYRAHMLLLCVEPDFRVVYIGDAIQIHSKVYPIFSGPKFWSAVEDNFTFPVGLVLESKDSLLLGAHVNDQGSGLFRIRGFQQLLQEVIHTDKEENPELHRRNEAYYLQNYITTNMISNEFPVISPQVSSQSTAVIRADLV